MNYHEIKHYKIQPNGELKLIRIQKKPEHDRLPSHRIVTSCFPQHVGETKGLKLYQMRTIITNRLRTGANPEVGDLKWFLSYTSNYRLSSRDVNRYGVVEAHRRRVAKYYERIRQRVYVCRQNMFEE